MTAFSKMNNSMYLNIVRWWLTFILVFIPLQAIIAKYVRSWNSPLASIVTRLDEITMIVCFILAVREYLKRKDDTLWLNLFWLIPVLLLGISGLVSGIMNGNALYVTCYGIYDYIKYFFVIFIFAAFFRDFSEYKQAFRIIIIVTAIIGAVAVIEELWAVVSRYILTNEFSDKFYYYSGIATESRWRFGIFRTSSLMGHYNQFGLYSLLVLIFYLSRPEHVNLKLILFLFAGVFLCVSRTIYTGLMFFLGMQLFQRKKKLRILVLLIPILIIIISMSFLSDFHVWELVSNGDKNYSNVIPYRVYASEKAMMVWKDHSILGVGPGMFGGGVANKTHTHLYEEYDFDPIMGGLDQFWPQILAEMGIVGAVAYAGLVLSFLVTLYEFKRRSQVKEVKNFFACLMIFMVILLIYSLGNRINVLDPILFTYFAFVGIGLGCIGREYGK